jgi:acetyl esterase/lipase
MLAKDGYVVASVEYRLSNVATFPAQIEDCKAAIRWLRANAEKYQLDPNRIGAFGRSAGGHLVALLGTCGDYKEWDKVGGNFDQPSNVQAVCDWFGPTNLATHPPVVARLDGKDSLKMLFGVDDLKDVPDQVANASPINHIHAGDPPFLIMHGDADNAVPIEQSESFADALKKANVDVAYKVVKVQGTGHGFPGVDLNKLIEGDVRPFFDRCLKQ